MLCHHECAYFCSGTEASAQQRVLHFTPGALDAVWTKITGPWWHVALLQRSGLKIFWHRRGGDAYGAIFAYVAWWTTRVIKNTLRWSLYVLLDWLYVEDCTHHTCSMETLDRVRSFFLLSSAFVGGGSYDAFRTLLYIVALHAVHHDIHFPMWCCVPLSVGTTWALAVTQAALTPIGQGILLALTLRFPFFGKCQRAPPGTITAEQTRWAEEAASLASTKAALFLSETLQRTPRTSLVVRFVGRKDYERNGTNAGFSLCVRRLPNHGGEASIPIDTIRITTAFPTSTLLSKKMDGILRNILIWEYALDAMENDTEVGAWYEFKGVVSHARGSYVSDPLWWPVPTSKIWFVAAGRTISVDINAKGLPRPLRLSDFADGGIAQMVCMAREASGRVRDDIHRAAGSYVQSTLKVLWSPDLTGVARNRSSMSTLSTFKVKIARPVHVGPGVEFPTFRRDKASCGLEVPVNAIYAMFLEFYRAKAAEAAQMYSAANGCSISCEYLGGATIATLGTVNVSYVEDAALWSTANVIPVKNQATRVTLGFRYVRGDISATVQRRHDRFLLSGCPPPPSEITRNNQGVTDWCRLQGWEVAFLTDGIHGFVETLHAAYQTSMETDNDRFLYTCALYAHECIAAALPRDLLDGAPTPKSVLIRTDPEHCWTWLSYRHFRERHVEKNDAAVRVQRDLSVQDLQAFGRIIGTPYDGPRYATFGDKRVFVSAPDAMPYFPSGVDVAQRFTYWHLPHENTRGDALIAPLHAMWNAIAQVAFDFNIQRSFIGTES